MRDYKTRVVSIRFAPELLEAVRERAAADGRSVSGEIVYFVREQVASAPRPPKEPRPITGWLAHRPSLGTRADFRKARAEASAHLERAIREKARRK